MPLPTDVFALAKRFWPHVAFYSKQIEIIHSVWSNDKTVAPANHVAGKDYVTAFLCLAFFLTRTPCRVITTSVDGPQLEGVLWGEIRNFIQTAVEPLDSIRGGPLLVNHMHIRKIDAGQVDGLSYLTGRVAKRGEGMSGHHIAATGDGIPRTLAVVDEASGVDDETFDKLSEWADRTLIIGNPYHCNNDFRWAVKGKPGTDDRGGDIPRPDGNGFARKVIHISWKDSPNCQEALRQQAEGREPDGKVVFPGILTWQKYLERRRTWDKVKQRIGLDGEFYEGAEVLLYPPQWLDRAESLAVALAGKPRKAKAVGIDPAEGGDKTAMCAVDEFGVIELVSKQTPDTSVITGEALAFLRKHNVPAEQCAFDRGGGGKEHADRLRSQGHDVRTVAFGETVTLDLHRGMRLIDEQLQNREERYAYVNRRAEMAGQLRNLLDPASERGFAIPAHYPQLRQQMCVIPLRYDGEGRLKLPPKNRRDGEGREKSLIELIGHSPDEYDALCLAVHTMLHEEMRPEAGAF